MKTSDRVETAAAALILLICVPIYLATMALLLSALLTPVLVFVWAARELFW